MILKFVLKLVVMDLMSYCWIWSKLNCSITGVVNWEMFEKQKKLCPIFCKMFNHIKSLMFKRKEKKISFNV